MPDTTPLRGASTVNDEFEVGFDERFENRWGRAEVAGKWLLFAVVLLGLSGLLGRGPFSHRSAEAKDGSLTVDYEPVARYGTPTQVTLHLRPAPGIHTERVLLGTGFVEPMGLQTVLPQPVTEAADQGGLALTIQMEPGPTDTLVRLGLKPTEVGPVPLEAHLDGAVPLRWSQFVLP